MKRTWYSGLNEVRSEVQKEEGPFCRLRERGWLALLGLLGSLVTFWWWGFIEYEALVGLAMFGAIWGGDRGPGSDEPLRRRDPVLSFLSRLFLRHRPRWLPPEVRGDVPSGAPEVAETGEDALAEELISIGLDELGRFVGGAVGWMKERQAVMWGDGPREDRFRAAEEHRAIYDVALEAARRGRSALADMAQGRRSVGGGLQELFEATDPLPVAQAVEEARRGRRAAYQEPDIWEPGDMPLGVPEAGPIPEPAELPREIPKIVTEHPPLEGRFFERAKEIGDPMKYSADFWNTVWEEYRQAEDTAKEYVKQMKKEGLIKEEEKQVCRTPSCISQQPFPSPARPAVHGLRGS